jgi:hypothetical protein
LLGNGEELDANPVGIIWQIQHDENAGDHQQASRQFLSKKISR